MTRVVKKLYLSLNVIENLNLLKQKLYGNRHKADHKTTVNIDS